MRNSIEPVLAVASMSLASLGIENAFALFFAALGGALVTLFVTKLLHRN